MVNSIIDVTDQSFEKEVIKSEKPVLVDFWAEWCGPCRMLGPVLHEIAEDYSDKLKIVKVNVDQNNSVPAQYNIRSIPALYLFKDGKVIASKIGALSKTQLAAFLDSSL